MLLSSLRAGLLALPIFYLVVSGENVFLLPGASSGDTSYRSNRVFREGETMEVEWTSDKDSVDLLLWQRYPKPEFGYFHRRIEKDYTSTYTRYRITMEDFITDIPDGESAVFSFDINRPGTTDSAFASSSYFNVTLNQEEEEPTSSTTVSTREPTTSPSARPTSTSTSASTSTRSQTAATSPAEDEDNEDLSNGAVAGIAVGVTIGGIALLAAMGFFLWKRMRGRGDSGSAPAAAATPSTPGYEQYKPSIYASPTSTPRWESSPFSHEQPRNTTQGRQSMPMQGYGAGSYEAP